MDIKMKSFYKELQLQSYQYILKFSSLYNNKFFSLMIQLIINNITLKLIHNTKKSTYIHINISITADFIHYN